MPYIINVLYLNEYDSRNYYFFSLGLLYFYIILFFMLDVTSEFISGFIIYFTSFKKSFFLYEILLLIGLNLFLNLFNFYS